MPLIATNIDRRPKRCCFHGLTGFLMVGIIGTFVTAWSFDAHAEEKGKPQHSVSSHQYRNAKGNSSRYRVGKASVYARKLAGKKMADGTKMNPHSDNAASKTLPLGTTAKVTNLQTGQSAKVTIRDRGPYVRDRILDVSPSTAHQIGISEKKGTAEVKVDPIAVPKSDSSGKSGVAAK